MILQTDIGDSTAIGRKLPTSSLSRTAVTVRWLVGVSGVATLLLLVTIAPPETTRYFVLFALAMFLSELLLTVRIGAGSYLSVSSAFLFVYFLVSGGVAAAFLDAATKLLVWLAQLNRRTKPPTPLFAFFSVGQAVISTLAAAFAVRVFAPQTDLSGPVLVRPLLSVMIFAVTYVVVNSAVSSLAAMARGIGELRNVVISSTGAWTLISLAISIPFALVLYVIAGALGFPYAVLLVFLMLAGVAFVLRLNVQLRHGNDELLAINRIGSAINATLDMSQLFRILARESRRVLPWDGFFIALNDPESSELQLIFMTSSGDEITQRTMPRGSGLTGRAIDRGETVLYERDEKEPSEEEGPLKGRKARSIAVAPMKFNQQTIGAISVQSLQGDVYRASEIRLLETIAAQAAIAIRNAQLFTSEQTAKNERDEFLSLVTHEIKNPLTSIGGYADVAEKALVVDDKPLIEEALQVIRGESKRILRLAEDLLDASKAAAGKFSVKPEALDLTPIVREITSRYQTTASRPIAFDVEAELPLVQGDAVRLAQVVENLVSNAVKYSAPEGEIAVQLRRHGRRVRLLVRDSGMGIPPEKLPLIFERFYRVVEDGTEVKGTGLGLFITREIVRMHGGTIDVQSTVEKGSTFTVDLPVAEAQGEKTT